MTCLGLAAVVVLTQVPAGDPADLVQQLGSGRYADREAASASLEVLGADALPALQAAAGDPDPEVRARVAGLRAKIEAMVLGRSMPLRIDAQDRALDEVFAAIGEQGPNRLAWHPRAPELSRRRLTLHEREPLPFWTAIDRLCRAGGLRYIPATPDGTVDVREPQFRLFLAPGTETCYRSDDGPLRLELIGLRQWRRVNLIPNSPDVRLGWTRGAPPPLYGERQATVTVDLRLLVEPRMLIQRYGDVLVTEAIDDRGQSLLRSDGPHVQRWGIGSYIPSQACISFSGLDLQSPPRPVKAIKRLRLTMPVEVVARRPIPLVIPLAGTEGRTFRSGKTTARVIGVTMDTSRFPRVLLSLSSEERVPVSLPLGLDGDRDPAETRPVRPEVTANVLQVFDEQGRQFPRYGGPNVSNLEDGGLRVELELDGYGANKVPERFDRGIVRPEPGRVAIPAELHYYEYTRAVVRASFVFQDIPFP